MSFTADLSNKISTLNSRTAASLAAGASWTGTWEDVSKWGRVGVGVTSSEASRGTLYFQVSHDGVTGSGPARMWTDTRYSQPHMWNIVEQYIRLKYVNGEIAVTDLSIQTQYSTNQSILLAHQLDETLLDETEAIVARAVLVGKDDDGDYRNVTTTLDGKLKVETDEFISLQSEILTTLKNIDKRLHIISGYEMIDKTENI